MSQSYRKPWVTDGYKGSNGKQYAKRCASRRVRHAEDVPNGKAYRKFYDPWKITDYRWYEDFKPYVVWRNGIAEWVYHIDRPWRILRK